MTNSIRTDADILIVGGTAAGCSAAIAAARAGASVVVLEPTSSLGGITTNGVHCFDTGTLQALSGTTEEFINRVRKYYSDAGLDHPMLRSSSDVFWEFHVAERIWREMIAETGNIRFINGAVAVGVKLGDGNRIEEVFWEPAIDPIGSLSLDRNEEPNSVRARIVIDATYEGDIAAWAGAAFDLGREARSPAEPHAGVIHTTTHDRHISADGYLPSTILPGSTGEGDDTIMSFTCRLSVRFRASGYEQYLIEQAPAGYDAGRYAWKPATISESGQTSFGTELIPSMFGKMLTNQRYWGDDRLQGNRDYILAHPRERSALRREFVDHALGFLYYIQTQGGMPQIGLSEDEYVDNQNVPHTPYVREGRRFHGMARLTEADVTAYLATPSARPPRQADSIAIGDWAVESRRCRDEPSPVTSTYDGSMFIRTLRAPYQVPFGCLVPQGVSNLLVTTTISVTHVAFCALRVEALWVQTGAAAGMAAALALRHNQAVAEVAVSDIQDALLQNRFKLTYFADVETSHPDFDGIQWLALRGFVPEDPRYRFFPDRSATWGDLMEASVKAFQLPISVTGIHFDGIDPDHPSFRYAETLYDTASRAGIELFRNMRHPVIDAPADHLLPESRQRWVAVQPDAPVRKADAAAFLRRLAEAVGGALSPTEETGLNAGGVLSRGDLASLAAARARR